MARVTAHDLQGYADNTKLRIDSVDEELLAHIETQVITRLYSIYDTTTWTNDTTTPDLIRTIISMLYVSWYYHRAYSEDSGTSNDYAVRLEERAEMLLSGLVDGTVDLPGVEPSSSSAGQPSFYPNDASSGELPNPDDWSLGGAYFSMGRSF